MKNIKALLVIILAFLNGCAYLGYLKDPFVDIANFRRVESGFFSGGLPKDPGLDLLDDLKIKTIISLRDELPDYEIDYIEKNKIKLVKIPMSIYRKPSDEQVLSFLETALNKNNRPIFLHCKDGRDRTGAMIAVYRTVVDGLGPKEAYKEALKFGFWPYRGDDVLKNYIHQLKDKKEFYNFVTEFNKNGAKD